MQPSDIILLPARVRRSSEFTPLPLKCVRRCDQRQLQANITYHAVSRAANVHLCGMSRSSFAACSLLGPQFRKNCPHLGGGI